MFVFVKTYLKRTPSKCFLLVSGAKSSEGLLLHFHEKYKNIIKIWHSLIHKSIRSWLWDADIFFLFIPYAHALYAASIHFYSWNEVNLYLWLEYLCTLRDGLDLKVFSHRSQGWETPSIWFDSMWSLMFLKFPSFPQTVQILNNSLPMCVGKLYIGRRAEPGFQ